MSFLVVVQDNKTNIIDVQERSTHGAASQFAAGIEPGQRARIVPKDLNIDVVEWFRQIKHKQELGFDPSYGVIPNGARPRGEGARGIGRMLFPAYGGMLEQVEAALPHESPDRNTAILEKSREPALTLSSTHSETMEKKLQAIMEKLNGIDG